tara:strand:- start:779 stop:916 length:138 start_codon:yes stop_codon:yes gene_type:complete
MDEIKWSYEELKKALLDSASDYDRIVQSMRNNDTKERKEKSTGEE